MPTRDELRTRLFLRAALPLVKIVREDNSMMRLFTKNMNAVVQFRVKGTETGAHLVFADDALESPASWPYPGSTASGAWTSSSGLSRCC
jgi:hypothetical protein